jgi:hypothetical protein
MAGAPRVCGSSRSPTSASSVGRECCNQQDSPAARRSRCGGAGGDDGGSSVSPGDRSLGPDQLGLRRLRDDAPLAAALTNHRQCRRPAEVGDGLLIGHPVAARGTSPPPRGAGLLQALHRASSLGPLPAAVETTTGWPMSSRRAPQTCLRRGRPFVEAGLSMQPVEWLGCAVRAPGSRELHVPRDRACARRSRQRAWAIVCWRERRQAPSRDRPSDL